MYGLCVYCFTECHNTIKKSVHEQIKQFELALNTPYCNDDRKELEQNKLNKPRF